MNAMRFEPLMKCALKLPAAVGYQPDNLKGFAGSGLQSDDSLLNIPRTESNFYPVAVFGLDEVDGSLPMVFASPWRSRGFVRDGNGYDCGNWSASEAQAAGNQKAGQFHMGLAPIRMATEPEKHRVVGGGLNSAASRIRQNAP